MIYKNQKDLKFGSPDFMFPLICLAVSKGYMWAYASFQFAIVILFAHIFYTVVKKLSLFSSKLA